jgi:hypothetical protein
MPGRAAGAGVACMAAMAGSAGTNDRNSATCPPVPALAGDGEAVADAARRSSEQSMTAMVALLFKPVPSPGLSPDCRPGPLRDPQAVF